MQALPVFDKKQNDALSAVAIATLLAPVSFCPEKQILHLQRYLLSEMKGPTWNIHSNHVVVTPINRN